MKIKKTILLLIVLGLILPGIRATEGQYPRKPLASEDWYESPAEKEEVIVPQKTEQIVLADEPERGTAEEVKETASPDTARASAQEAVPSAEERTETQPAPQAQTVSRQTVESAHQHHWVEEFVTHHDAVYETVHHDAVTEEYWVSVPRYITKGYCNTCGMEFDSQDAAYEHESETRRQALEAGDLSLAHSGHTIVHDYIDDGYWGTRVVEEAWDEEVEKYAAWDEYIFRCTECGATG